MIKHVFLETGISHKFCKFHSSQVFAGWAVNATAPNSLSLTLPAYRDSEKTDSWLIQICMPVPTCLNPVGVRAHKVKCWLKVQAREMKKTRNKEDKNNNWDQMPSLLRSTASHILFVRESSTKVSRGLLYNVGKKNTGYFRQSCLKTDNHNQGKSIGSTEATTLTPSDTGSKPQTSLVKSTPGQWHRMKAPFFFCPFIRASERIFSPSGPPPPLLYKMANTLVQ